MYNIIAIEGIDQIGKSTFINELYNRLSKRMYSINNLSDPLSIEKPTIGINTLGKNAYPFANTRSIMEMRNIGLFEELLFQIQHHNKYVNGNKTIIRDRFHLSELAYGKILRPEYFDYFGTQSASGYEKYTEWTRWFEKQLIETGANIKLIVFTLDDESTANEDESVSSKNLNIINNEFKILYDESLLPKKMFTLHKNIETGMTNILDFIPNVLDMYDNRINITKEIVSNTKSF